MVHCIIMSSSYSNGTRIAIDYCFENIEKSFFIEKINEIVEKCGEDVQISTHYIQTSGSSWETVCEKDTFFENVEVVYELDEFIDLINRDRELQGIDVAKYILSRVACTHLKLEKLVYLCYADYLCSTKRKLFNDTIYAFRYGPVVESVYERYKGEYGELESDSKDIESNDAYELPAKSRILFARYGLEKYNSIEKTLRMYSQYSASELVEITHQKNSPWNKSLSSEYYDIIDDDTILEFHCNESK